DRRSPPRRAAPRWPRGWPSPPGGCAGGGRCSRWWTSSSPLADSLELAGRAQLAGRHIARRYIHGGDIAGGNVPVPGGRRLGPGHPAGLEFGLRVRDGPVGAVPLHDETIGIEPPDHDGGEDGHDGG